MIKNWVVKVEQIKVDSIDRHKTYLLNNKHENHLESDIKKVFYGKSFDLAFAERAEALVKSGKPDRSSYKNYATSFVFGPPGDLAITDKQAITITGEVVKGIAKVLGVEASLLQKYCVSVLHREKPPKHGHFHFLISNVVDGRFRKELTQHKTKFAIQKVIDIQYKKHFGLDRSTYEPDPENIGKNTPLWKKRMDKHQSELNKVLMVWLSDTVKRYKKRFTDAMEQPKPAKSFLSTIGNIFKGVLSVKDKPEPAQIENADKVVKLAVETHKTAQQSEIKSFLMTIKEHEATQQVEPELLISDKIAAGIEIEKAKPERPKLVSVSDDRTDEQRAAAMANYEKLKAKVDQPKPKPKSYRAAAVRNAKNK